MLEIVTRHPDSTATQYQGVLHKAEGLSAITYTACPPPPPPPPPKYIFMRVDQPDASVAGPALPAGAGTHMAADAAAAREDAYAAIAAGESAAE